MKRARENDTLKNTALAQLSEQHICPLFLRAINSQLIGQFSILQKFKVIEDLVDSPSIDKNIFALWCISNI